MRARPGCANWVFPSSAFPQSRSGPDPSVRSDRTMTPWSRPATRLSTPTGRPTRRRRSMLLARAACVRPQAGGWRLASPPARDANELVGTLAGALKAGANVLYLAGRDRKEAIEAALAEKFELEVVEAYAAEAREAWRPAEARSSRILRRGAALFAQVGRACGGAGEGSGRGSAVSLNLIMFAFRAMLRSLCRHLAQVASPLPKRLMKWGFFEGCAKSSAGSLRAGRPVYRAARKPRARGDGRRGNKGRFRWASGRPGQS